MVKELIRNQYDLPNYEVKILPKFDLSKKDREFIEEKIKEACEKYNMYLHKDGVTYSKNPPYGVLADLGAGVKFYFALRPYREKYLTLFEYYSYAEGDINGRLIGRPASPRL